MIRPFLSLYNFVQIFPDQLHGPEKDLLIGRLHMIQQALEKGILHHTPLADDRVCLAGAEKLCFAAVAGHGIAFQIALLHQLVHIHGDEVRLDMPHLHDVPGRFIVRVVGEEQQNVQRRLRQAKLLTQRFADGIVRLRSLDGKFDIRVHSRSVLSSLNDSFLKYYSAEEGRCQGGTPSVAAYAAPAPSRSEPLAWRQNFRAYQRPHPRGRLPPAGTDSPRAGEKCHRR